jgi:hypothetical protein
VSFSVLLSELAVGPLAPAAIVVVPHNLIVDGLPLAPTSVMPDRGTPIIVTAITSTTVTFQNMGAIPSSANFRAEFTHSIQRNPLNIAPQLWQGDVGGGGSVGGAGLPGQVAFWDTPATIAGDNGLFWDNVTKRLGIGTAAPTVELQVVGSLLVNGTAQFDDTTVVVTDSLTGLRVQGLTSGNTILLTDHVSEIVGARSILPTANDVFSLGAVAGGWLHVYGGASGAAADPTFSWENNTDTGMYRDGANSVAIATAGISGFSVNVTSVDDETAISVTADAGNTQFRVTTGANDSGGVGFRLLRILNL